MMKKRVLALVIFVAMMSGIFTGCAGSTTAETSAQSSESSVISEVTSYDESSIKAESSTVSKTNESEAVSVSSLTSNTSRITSSSNTFKSTEDSKSTTNSSTALPSTSEASQAKKPQPTETSKDTESSKTTETSKSITSTTPSKTDEQKIYNELFNVNNKISVKIDISNSELQKMQRDYEKYSNKGSKSPIYRRANKVTFTINGKKYEINDVGIRMKGNTSRDDFYSSSKGIYNLTHYKLSFTETFDNEDYYGDDAEKWASNSDRKARKNRTFATLEKLDIKWNRNYDKTYCREYYAYSVFRSEGVLAPRLNMSEMTIGGEYFGICTIYEPVDEIFINRNLPKEDQGGDLYKAMWTNDPANYTNRVTYGIEDEDKCKFYNYDLKTNKKKSTHASIKNLISVLNSGSMTKSKLESLIDVDNFMSFVAVSYFMGNPDDMRNNYNNHYVYFRKSDGKAIFIPYDYDRTLGVTCGWNPTGDGMVGVSPFSGRAEGANQSQANPLYKYTILAGGYYRNEYKAALAEVVNGGYLNINKFTAVYNKVKANYENSVKPGRNFENADSNKFRFSINSDEDNMTISKYFEGILKTYNAKKNG